MIVSSTSGRHPNGFVVYSALTEGKGKISVDAEIIAYGVLDVVSHSNYSAIAER